MKGHILAVTFAFLSVLALFGLSQLSAGAIVYFVSDEVLRKWLLSLSIEGIYLAAALALAFFAGNAIMLRKIDWPFAFFTVIGAAGFLGLSDLASDLLIFLLSEKSRVMADDYCIKPVITFLTAGGSSSLPVNLFLGAAVPAVCEELFFRGTLLTFLLRTLKPATSVIITGFLFALVHVNPLIFLPLFLMGVMCGYVCLRTRNILYPILFHFVNNALIVIIFHATGRLSFAFSAERIFLMLSGAAVLFLYFSRLPKMKAAVS